MADKIIFTHLHDGFGKSDDHLPPGIGTFNWEAILQALKRTGYRRPMMPEISGAIVYQ